MKTPRNPTVDDLIIAAGDAMLERAEKWSSDHDDCPPEKVPPATLIQAAIDGLLAHTQKPPPELVHEPPLELDPASQVVEPPPPPGSSETKVVDAPAA